MMEPFGSGLDRAAHLRGAPPEGRCILLCDDGVVTCDDGIRLFKDESPAGAQVFLGIGPDGPIHARRTGPLPAGMTAATVRDMLPQVAPWLAEAAATAHALFNWHATHGFCARCGHPTDMVLSGWQRQCPACGAPHFPRTDPVVIMLVTTGDRILLGRSPGWRVHMYSCLAGFMEPGETVEAAVRREVFEETGVQTGDVRYLQSQSWPFPASLMLGCIATARSTDITLDPTEVEAARWADKAEVMEALLGRHPDLALPNEGTIARNLILGWLADRVDCPHTRS